jgi:long-chain acyl-CoA synthetase
MNALNAAAPGDAGRTAAYRWLQHYPKQVDWHQTFGASPLYALLDGAAARFGSRPCTNFLGKSLTYREIAGLVERAAAGLQKLGVRKGSKVGLFMPNCPTFIIYYFATLKAGGTVVNYNPLYTLEELTFQIKDSETELMVTLDLKVLFDKVETLMQAGALKRAVVASFAALLPGAKSVLFKLFKGKDLAHVAKSPMAGNIVADGDVLDNDGKYARPAIDPVNDIAVLQYTGGTTGTPKGAMLTHANVTVNCRQGAAWAPNLVPGKERVLAALPFFHVFAMTAVMNFAIAEGAELIIMPRFVLDDAMKLVDKTKPTVMPGVPTMFIAMLIPAFPASISRRSSSASRAARRCPSTSSSGSRRLPAARWWRATDFRKPPPASPAIRWTGR